MDADRSAAKLQDSVTKFQDEDRDEIIREENDPTAASPSSNKPNLVTRNASPAMRRWLTEPRQSGPWHHLTRSHQNDHLSDSRGNFNGSNIGDTKTNLTEMENHMKADSSQFAIRQRCDPNSVPLRLVGTGVDPELKKDLHAFLPVADEDSKTQTRSWVSGEETIVISHEGGIGACHECTGEPCQVI